MKKQLQIRVTKCRGFNLIEILVTMLIMAVGLLGIAALQFKGLQYNADAYTRSQINFLAYDIADRIRLNKANANAYQGGFVIGANIPVGCNPVAGANSVNDLACWRVQVYNALPPGTQANIIETAPAGSGIYEVNLVWTDRGNPPFVHNIRYSFQP